MHRKPPLLMILRQIYLSKLTPARKFFCDGTRKYLVKCSTVLAEQLWGTEKISKKDVACLRILVAGNEKRECFGLIGQKQNS